MTEEDLLALYVVATVTMGFIGARILVWLKTKGTP